MSELHQKHKHKLPDSCFETGTFRHIVPGNKGRVLDGRRTPGVLEKYYADTAMFVWRITDFEDKGRYWEIPAEEISQYQFEKQSAKLSEQEAENIANRSQSLSRKLVIHGHAENYRETQKLVSIQKDAAKEWFSAHSEFVKLGQSRLDLLSETGSALLYDDLACYMEHLSLLELEQKTAQQYVLNPNSGEWVKGLRIVMAELGLIDFDEKQPRTPEIFQGTGSRDNRKKYIISRLAFVQTFFQLAGYHQVQLFRGMATEGRYIEKPRTLLSATFDPEVAKAFSKIDMSDQAAFSYLFKFTYPIDNLFMTYFETELFNTRYKEREAVILYRDRLVF